MDRNIGVNFKKEADAMLKYKRFPALKHTTRVHTEYSYCDDSNYDKNSQCGKNSNNCNIDLEFSINNHTYKVNKKNLLTVGLGTLAAISVFKTYRALTRA